MLLNRIDSIPASEKAETLYLRIYPYVDPDKITTMFLFATSPLLSQSGNTKSSIKGNTLNSDILVEIFRVVVFVAQTVRAVVRAAGLVLRWGAWFVLRPMIDRSF